MTVHDDCDVVVVGAGPVGQVTALLLARWGLRVVVLERWEKAYPLPRAVALAHDVVRVLHTLELDPPLDDMLDPWGRDGQEFVLESANGQPLAQTQYALNSASGHPQMSGFSQPDLEARLDARVRAVASIDQRRGVTMQALRTVDDHVYVLATDEAGVEFTVRARYVVGCDGANSAVREHIGGPITDLEFDRDWLVVDVVPHGPMPPAMRHAGQRLDPARPTTFVPAGPGRRRFEFMVMAGDDPARLDTDVGSWELLRPWGFDPSNATLTRHARYTFRARWAAQWRAGRIMIAGDAAHQMPPFLGQGLNSGIRDAANLAWRLALVAAGTGRDTLLDDYATERRDQAEMIVRGSVALGGLICVTGPQQAAHRDDELARSAGRLEPAQTCWPLRAGTFRDDAGAGVLALQARVGIGVLVGMLDEVCASHDRFLLLGADRDPVDALDASVAAGWRSVGGMSGHFGPWGWSDVDGKYRQWFDTLGARVVLVRPDFHVFGTSGGGTATTNLLVADLLRRVTTRKD